MGHYAQPGEDRALPARGGHSGGEGRRRVRWHDEGEDRPDHGQLQGHREVRGGRRREPPRRPPGHRPRRSRPGYGLGDHRLDLAGRRRRYQGQRRDRYEAHRTRGPVRTGHRPGRGDEGGAAAAGTAESTGEENGSRDGSQQEEAPPAAATGGTAGRVISSEDPTVMAGGTVEGAVVAGTGSAKASSGAPTAGTEQPEPQQAPRREREEPEAFDIGAASQEAILKRAKPLLIGAGVLLVLIWLLRRR